MKNLKETQDILIRHAKKYPLMRPRDAIKLLYQNEFGGGHIISDQTESLVRIKNEHAGLNYTPETFPVENIGNGLCRYKLQAIPDSLAALSALNRAFTAGANNIRGDSETFSEKLTLITKLADEGLMSFSTDEAKQYLDEYISSGMPMERHSEEYRLAYSPAYRVIPLKYVPCLSLMTNIDELLDSKKRLIIGIDGPCGSGKTSLANVLMEIYSCPVISMDDFFLPPELRTRERLDEPGGNIHYERFLDEAVPYIKSGSSFSYRIFDCGSLDYAGTKEIPAYPVTICEGSYSMHPLFGGLYDYKVFVKCDPYEQHARLLNRGGAALYERFKNEWIPMESRYFETFGIEGSCDFIFNSSHA